MKRVIALAMTVIMLLIFSACKERTWYFEKADDSSSEKFEKIENPEDLIEIYDQYTNMNFCCEYKKADVEDIIHALSEEQSGWVSTVVKSKCCKTKNRAIEHIKHYIDESMLENLYEDCFLEYDGELYVLLGAVGYISHDYDNMRVREGSKKQIFIKTDFFNSGGECLGSDEFAAKKINGTYRIVGVVERR